MRPKKILYIGNKLSKHGNTATSIETLGTFLELEGYDVLYASDKKNKIIRLLDMIFTTIKNHRNVFVVLIDVYSTQNFWYALLISQLCRFLKLPYLAKLHGGNLPNRLIKNPKLSNLIFKHAKANVAPSNYLLSQFKQRFGSNTLYIPNTIDISFYDFKQRESLQPKILWVRSLSSIYNPFMAMDVISHLKKDFPDVELAMVGPDKENMVVDCLEYAKKWNLNIRFLGKLEKSEWITLAKDYSIFINTSNFDNMPITIIEAMALGLPVVSTNVGGIPFMLTDRENALLVNPNDAVGMANAIRELLCDFSFQYKMAKSARNSIEVFDWQIVKKKWKVILQSLQ